MARDESMVEAEVLAINEKVLQGKLIGGFLSGSSGWFNGSTVVVGVRVVYDDMLFLVDITMNTAELVHFKDRKTIPVQVEHETPTFWNFGDNWVKMYFLGKRFFYIDDEKRFQEAKRLYREE